MNHFLKGMLVITIMALLYIHLQMNIYALGYEGRKNEARVEQLAERNSQVRNDVLRLKSSDNIGRELLGKENAYQFASRRDVVEVESGAEAGSLVSRMAQGQGFLGRIMTVAFVPNRP
jgi:predicted ATPase